MSHCALTWVQSERANAVLLSDSTVSVHFIRLTSGLLWQDLPCPTRAIDNENIQGQQKTWPRKSQKNTIKPATLLVQCQLLWPKQWPNLEADTKGDFTDQPGTGWRNGVYRKEDVCFILRATTCFPLFHSIHS